MKAAPFHYHDPRSCDDLIGLLGRLDDMKLLAGGQSLMPMMNYRVVTPQHVVDLNRVAGLSGIEREGDAVVFGALTRQRAIQMSPLVAKDWPVLQRALDHVGHYQTRARGTIGGSCCHLDPAAELPAICLLHDAEFRVAGPDGGRVIAAQDWFQGLMTSALDEREVLESIRLPRWQGERIGGGFHEVARRHGDFAVAGAACLVALASTGLIERVSVVVFGATENPLRLADAEDALIGQKPDEQTIAAAVAEISRLDVMSDVHVSAEYRAKIAAVTVKRALADAFAQALGART